MGTAGTARMLAWPFVIGCWLAFLVSGRTFGQQAEDVDQRLISVLQQQAVDWNRGDIDAFMRAYWKSEKLTFSSGGTTNRGWTVTRDRYHSKYPNRELMGRLTFSEFEVQQLGRESALVLGRWMLDREQPLGGNFTLVWKKFPVGWRIVHDHTSVDPAVSK